MDDFVLCRQSRRKTDPAMFQAAEEQRGESSGGGVGRAVLPPIHHITVPQPLHIIKVYTRFHRLGNHRRERKMTLSSLRNVWDRIFVWILCSNSHRICWQDRHVTSPNSFSNSHLIGLGVASERALCPVKQVLRSFCVSSSCLIRVYSFWSR